MTPTTTYLNKKEKLKRFTTYCLSTLCLIQSMGCSREASNEQASTQSSLSGEAWTPQVPLASASHHASQISITKQVQTVSGKLFGLAESFSKSDLVTVHFTVPTDLGESGSVTLLGEVENIPPSVGGGAFAYLFSVKKNPGTDAIIDPGSLDFINLDDSCYAGLFNCSGGSCSPSVDCTTQWPSAYSSRSAWEIKQIDYLTGEDQVSVNTFPNCRWADGESGSSSSYDEKPACAFNSDFFPSQNGQLKSGSYTAQYALVSGSRSDLADVSAQLKFTLLTKKNSSVEPSGAIDLNVILVGTQNVTASRTEAGKRNLNSLINSVAKMFQSSDQFLGLGEVHAIEWYGAEADALADLNINSIGELFKKTASLVPLQTEGRAINVFLVSSIVDQSSSSDLTILGVSGGIGGSPINGKTSSGLVFSTFENLALMNPNCISGATVCSEDKTDADFNLLLGTMTHELGHFLGLFHTSESSGTVHDALYDTPICRETGSLGYITTSSCLSSSSDTLIFPVTNKNCFNDCAGDAQPGETFYDPVNGIFCPLATSCPFNNLMWWLSKYYDDRSHRGDGNLISDQQKGVINFSPLVW